MNRFRIGREEKLPTIFCKSSTLIYLNTTDSVGPEGDVGEVPVVGSDAADGTDFGVGVDEEAVRPSRSRVNLSTSAVFRHEESIGWSRFPRWATQT